MPRDGINRRAIAKLQKKIQREFDKRPIRIALETDGSDLGVGTTIYNGPVFQGDVNGAQLAWDNQSVSQVQHTQQIAPGFESIAQAVVETLKELSAIGLVDADLEDADKAGRDVLAEVTAAEPDRSKIRRALAALRGVLAPVALGMAGATGQELAREAIERLSTTF